MKKLKKLLIITLSIIMLICMISVFTSCANSSDQTKAEQLALDKAKAFAISSSFTYKSATITGAQYSGGRYIIDVDLKISKKTSYITIPATIPITYTIKVSGNNATVTNTVYHDLKS